MRLWIPRLRLAELLAFVALVLVVISPGAGDTSSSGENLFDRRCGGCHALDRDKEGPRLGGVYGRRAGSVESFEYSRALSESGITWNDATLEAWLSDTGKLVPGNEMDFRVEKAEERRAIIGFLKQRATD